MSSKLALLPAALVGVALILIDLYTYFVATPAWSWWLESAIFYTLVFPEGYLVALIALVFGCYFYCVPFHYWRHATKMRGQALAGIVIVPTALIALNSSWTIPWLLKLLEQLQNDYWERQIVLALIGQGAICVALLGLVWRISTDKPHRSASKVVWCAVVIAYSLVGAYILQSHFPAISKVVIATLSALAISTARLGIRADAEAH